MGISYNPNHPVETNELAVDLDDIRNQLNFMQAAAASGSLVLPGWSTHASSSANPPDLREPTTVELRRGRQKIFIHYTWTDGNVSAIQFCYDDGVSDGQPVCFDPTPIFYDENGNLIGTSPAWATEEWVVGPTSSVNFRYGHLSLSGGWTTIADHGSTPRALATDGQFVFTGDSGATINQHAWDGAAFSLVESEAGVGGGGNNVGHMGIGSVPRRLIATNHLAFGHGASLVEFDTSAPFTMTNLDNEEPADDNWGGITSVRFSNPLAYGERPDLFIIHGNSGQIARSYTLDGLTLSPLGSLAINGACEADPDTGLMVNNTGTTTMPLYQVNMATGAISSLGTSSTIASRAWACAIKGMVVVLGTDTNLYSYSVSGTTLTQLDSIAVGMTHAAQSKVRASPFTGFLYVTKGGAGKAFHLADDGELTLIDDIQIWDSGTGMFPSFGWMPEPLVVT